MATTLNSSGVLFPDGTTQTTASTGIPTPSAGTVVRGVYFSATMYNSSWSYNQTQYAVLGVNSAITNSPWQVTNTSYAKAGRQAATMTGSTSGRMYQKIKILKGGTFRCYVGLGPGFNNTGCSPQWSNSNARIYKNGVAVGTERSTLGSPTYYGNWTEDLTFDTGDVVELYIRLVGGNGFGVCAYLQLGVASEDQLNSFVIIGA